MSPSGVKKKKKGMGGMSEIPMGTRRFFHSEPLTQVPGPFPIMLRGSFRAQTQAPVTSGNIGNRGQPASHMVVIATVMFLQLGFHPEVMIGPCGGLLRIRSYLYQ